MALKSLKTDTLNRVSDINGLVHIETQTFSAVSSFSFSNDVFTSDFDNYKVLLYLAAPAQVAASWRGRIAGVDTTSTNYNVQAVFGNNTAVTGSRATSQSSGRVGLVSSETVNTSIVLDIFSPKLSQATNVIAVCHSAASNAFYETNVSNFALTTSFDSLTIVCANITGKAFLYGYTN